MCSNQPDKNLKSPELSAAQENSPISENDSVYELVAECDGSSEGDNNDELETSPESKVSSMKCLEVALFRNLILPTGNKEKNHLICNKSFPEANENIDSQGPFDDVIICDELIQKVDEYLHGDTENVFQDEGFKGVGAIEEVESENVQEGYDMVEIAGAGLCEEIKLRKKGVESLKDEETDSENKCKIIHESRIVENESIVKNELERNEDEATIEEEISAYDTLGASITCEDDSNFHGTDNSGESNTNAVLEEPSCVESRDVTSGESKDEPSVKSTEDRCGKSKDDVNLESKDDMVDFKDDANLQSKEDVSFKSKDDAYVEYKVDANLESIEDVSFKSKDNANLEYKDDASIESKDDASIKFKDDANLESKDDVSIISKDNAIVDSKDDSGEASKDDVNVQPIDDISILPTPDVSVQPTDDVSPQSTLHVSVQPTDDVSPQSTPHGSAQPTDDASVQPKNLSIQPDDDVSTQPTPEVSTKTTTVSGTEDEDSNDVGDVHMESCSDIEDSTDTVPMEVQHSAGAKDEPWYQPFSFSNLPCMFDTDDAKTIKTHWDLFCINSSKSCKEKFLKECVSLSESKYFVEICLNMSRDTRITKDLDTILNIVNTNWAKSSDAVVLRRSVLVIQALFSNKSCKLNTEQRKKLTGYLIMLITKKTDRNTYNTVMRSIPHLFAEVVKKRHKNNEISTESFKYVVNLLEVILCKEPPPVDSRILCGLLGALLRMPIGALFHVIPKCFDKLCKVTDDARDVLRKKNKEMLIEYPESSDDTFKFDNKMDKLTGAMHMYWKLCDACEVLLAVFFAENFTPDAVIDHVASCQSYTFWTPRLNHESLLPFYGKCLDYFGETLTNRLSIKYSQDKIARFLDILDDYCSVRVLDNRFVARNQHTFADAQERRAKRIKLMYEGPSLPTEYNFQRLPEKFKNLELRFGLIDVSRTNVPLNTAPKRLMDAQTFKPPDNINTEMLNKLSKIYAAGCAKLLERTSK